MTSVVVPSQTAEFGRRWLMATLGAAVVAGMIPVIAGGPGTWLRVVMAIVTIVGFRFAALHRWTLDIPVVLALMSVFTVPDTAWIDRAVVALPTAIAVLVAIECAVVTRRLDTAAPVSSTVHDPPAVAALVAASVIAGAIVVAFAQLDTFEVRALAAGGTIALAVVALIVRGRVEDDRSG
jgi:hypothetical protein